MKPAFHLKKALLVLAIAAAYPLYGHTAAGIAQFTSGEVTVRRGTTLIPLSKGRDIESGDAIVTGAGGRAQLRFTDGGIVSLQPDTQFVINRYVDANDPKQDSYLVDFLRGSMRTITGLIGKRNRENYKVQTTTATVGIRGSGFSASYNADGTMSISTELDEIEVCTKGGCVRLTAGESALVVNNDAPPARTQVRASQPAPANSQEVTVEGNKVTAKGLTAIVTVTETKETPAKTPDPVPVIEVVTGMQAAFVGTVASGSPNLSDSVGENGNNLDQFTLETLSGKTQLNKLVTTYTSPGVTNQGLTLASFGSDGAVSDAGFIGWGHWATANQVSAGVYGGTSAINDLHYVVGKPTPVNDINALSGMIGTYSLIGGTASFKPYSGASQIGIVTAGSLSVEFNNPGNINYITGTVATKFGATTVNVNLGTSTGCGARFSGGSANVVGLFTGAAAAKAGLVFKAPTSALGGGDISGSAAFRQTGLVSAP